MEIRLAVREDIDQLIQLRIDFLKDEFCLSSDDESLIKIQLNSYFNKYLLSDSFIGVLVVKENIIVSTAFLVIQEKPANHLLTNGLSGTLLNVFTYPEYRKQGYATKVVERIIEEAGRKKVSVIDLSATADGLAIYSKLGFKEISYTAMKLKL